METGNTVSRGVGGSGLPLRAQGSPPSASREAAIRPLAIHRSNDHGDKIEPHDGSGSSAQGRERANLAEPREIWSRERLKREIEEYVKQAYLEITYEDQLSGCRTRLFEPQWHATDSPQPSFQSQRHLSGLEASLVLRHILAPVIDWYVLSETEAKAGEAVERQNKIARALDRYEGEGNARLGRQDFSGRVLYRNVLDAGIEVNILTLVNRAHEGIHWGRVDHAAQLIDKALNLATRLDYHPISAKCWYWKGVVCHKHGSRAEAAECFFNALPAVGKYIEGDYLPRYIQYYRNDMLDTLEAKGLIPVEDRREWAGRLTNAAVGVEPLDFPSPRQQPTKEVTPVSRRPPEPKIRRDSSSPGNMSSIMAEIDDVICEFDGSEDHLVENVFEGWTFQKTSTTAGHADDGLPNSPDTSLSKSDLSPKSRSPRKYAMGSSTPRPRSSSLPEPVLSGKPVQREVVPLLERRHPRTGKLTLAMLSQSGPRIVGLGLRPKTRR